MRRFKVTIRAKLLLLSIAVLSIPYVGFEYLRELERYLRDALEMSLIDAARSMAGPLHERSALFPVRTDIDYMDDLGSIYVHSLDHPVQLDGYADDWISYLDWTDKYAPDNQDETETTNPFYYRLIVSRYQQHLNILLQVHDSDIVYQNPNTPDSIENDHVILVFTEPSGELIHHYFSPAAPGRLRPFLYERHWDEFNFEYQTVKHITNVIGEWQRTEDGYNLEVAIPVTLIGERLGIIVTDVDDPDSRTVANQIGTAGENTYYRPGKLLQSSPEVKQIIKGLDKTDGRRIWVLDNHGQVLASGGSLEKSLTNDSVNFFYSLILPSVYKRFQDDLAGASRLKGEEIKRALQGETETRWRSSPDSKAIIISAATPVWIGDEIRGVVVVEETTNGIQMLQRHAMASLFNKTVAVFFLVTMLLLLFATRLSVRLRRLSKEAESAIDEHGRVVDVFSATNQSDEIGELSRNYAAMLNRLKQYNDYLEGMAGKLSHELRTPIAVVQSSLEHLSAGGLEQDKNLYLERAREGIERLNLIVLRLSEATRLEQALQTAEMSETDINSLLSNCVEGYRLAYPEVNFELSLPETAIVRAICPDLMVQMLDKLVANAVDFRVGGKAIEIALHGDEHGWRIQVMNYGSSLPAVMENQLFNSMVSVRAGKSGKEPHLGLGLYIVRLIVEYHGGIVQALNISEENKVIFQAAFPA